MKKNYILKLKKEYQKWIIKLGFKYVGIESTFIDNAPGFLSELSKIICHIQ